MAETIYILLGSNSGDRERNLKNALSRLRDVEGFEIVASSAIASGDASGVSIESGNWSQAKTSPRSPKSAAVLLDQISFIFAIGELR